MNKEKTVSKTYQGPYSFAGLKGRGEAIVLDCETTGTNTETDRVVAVAAIRIDLEKWVRKDTFKFPACTATLDPGRPTPHQATSVHGIRDSDVAGEPTFEEVAEELRERIENRSLTGHNVQFDKQKFEEVAEELREWIGDRPLIGHNVQFDKQIINAEFKRAGVKPITGKGFCTMGRYRVWNDGTRKERSSLDNVARVLGVAGRDIFARVGRATQKHSALENARLAMRIAQMFYLKDTGRKDLLPGGPPGLDNEMKIEYSKESKAADGCAWMIIVALAIIVYSLLFSCS